MCAQSYSCVVTVDGGFSPWTEWSECSKSCGWGYQSRDRECNAPEPSRGGKDCTSWGDSNELQACMIVECPGNYFDNFFIVRQDTSNPANQLTNGPTSQFS